MIKDDIFYICFEKILSIYNFYIGYKRRIYR